MGSLVFGKIIAWAKYIRKHNERYEVKRKPPKFLDALENSYISLRKMQFEKKIQMTNNEVCLTVLKKIKEKLEFYSILLFFQNYLDMKRKQQ